MRVAWLVFACAASFALVVLRVYWLALYACYGSSGALMLAASGLACVVLTCWAWSRGVPDLSLGGLLVGVGYLAPLTIRPEGELGLCAGALLGALLVAKWVVRLVLLGRDTVTGPVWVELIDRGPFAIVRHPMTFVDTLSAAVCVAAWCSPSNLAALGLVVGVNLCSIELEERFLMARECYRDYAERVRWRLIPGLW